jgi:hypothetical protein
MCIPIGAHVMTTQPIDASPSCHLRAGSRGTVLATLDVAVEVRLREDTPSPVVVTVPVEALAQVPPPRFQQGSRVRALEVFRGRLGNMEPGDEGRVYDPPCLHLWEGVAYYTVTVLSAHGCYMVREDQVEPAPCHSPS